MTNIEGEKKIYLAANPLIRPSTHAQKCEFASKQGRIHGKTVADGWAKVVMQKNARN